MATQKKVAKKAARKAKKVPSRPWPKAPKPIKK
jgi:hypothetical protein